MADVISFSPGLAGLQIASALRKPLPVCDFCDAQATQRIQGETDSFGCEIIDACDTHAGWIRAGLTFTDCIGCETYFVIPNEYDYDKPSDAQPEQHTCPACLAGGVAQQ